MILGTKKFISNINKETSYNSQTLGTHTSTMDLHSTDDPAYCFIEWNILTLEHTETVGIFLEGKALSDYDGVFSLPKEAIELLRENNITVSEEFL